MSTIPDFSWRAFQVVCMIDVLAHDMLGPGWDDPYPECETCGHESLWHYDSPDGDGLSLSRRRGRHCRGEGFASCSCQGWVQV